MKPVVQQLLIISLLMALVAGCVSPGGRQMQVVRADVARVTEPDISAQEMAELVGGNNAFAFDLYHALREGEGNLFYSPLSISIALAMTWAGARGETERQMAETLHFTLPQDRLHPAFNALDLELAQRGQGAKGKDGKGFRLHIVNALWGQQGYRFLPDFLETLARHYDAGMQLLDFASDPEAARGTINGWVSKQTEGRIKDLLPPGTVNPLTRLVLTNAIYFNAAWAEQFDRSDTRNGVFYLLDGSQVTVPMMQQTASYGYLTGEGFQAVELPYDGNELAMVILLPDAGRFEEFEDSLDAGRVKELLDGLTYERVTLTMPRFRVESSFGLADTLATLGMPAAFQPDQADFSGMDGSRNLYIGAVQHKAFVVVDESGTEAAAATGVVIGLTAFRPHIEVTVDRPFIFLIRDLQTGTVLFVGRVVNPAS
ncbi:MAG: serpin family protein [Anaerolineae bacterium]|nr:serpin family protein [Anaerolineae bacterium]